MTVRPPRERFEPRRRPASGLDKPRQALGFPLFQVGFSLRVALPARKPMGGVAQGLFCRLPRAGKRRERGFAARAAYAKRFGLNVTCLPPVCEVPRWYRADFQSSFACSILSRRDETKFHQIYRGPSKAAPPRNIRRARRIARTLMQSSRTEDQKRGASKLSPASHDWP